MFKLFQWGVKGPGLNQLLGDQDVDHDERAEQKAAALLAEVVDRAVREEVLRPEVSISCQVGQELSQCVPVDLLLHMSIVSRKIFRSHCSRKLALSSISWAVGGFSFYRKQTSELLTMLLDFSSSHTGLKFLRMLFFTTMNHRTILPK